MCGRCVAQLLCICVVYLALDKVVVVEAEIEIIYRLELSKFYLHGLNVVLLAGGI